MEFLQPCHQGGAVETCSWTGYVSYSLSCSMKTGEGIFQPMGRTRGNTIICSSPGRVGTTTLSFDKSSILIKMRLKPLDMSISMR